MDIKAFFLSFLTVFIPWIFSEFEFYWKLFISLVILLIVLLINTLISYLKLKKIQEQSEERGKRITELTDKNETLSKNVQQVERDRVNVALLYTNTDKDIERLLDDLSGTRPTLHYIHAELNSLKTSKNKAYIEVLKSFIDTFETRIEKERENVRERRISSNKDN